MTGFLAAVVSKNKLFLPNRQVPCEMLGMGTPGAEKSKVCRCKVEGQMKGGELDIANANIRNSRYHEVKRAKSNPRVQVGVGSKV